MFAGNNNVKKKGYENFRFCESFDTLHIGPGNGFLW